MKKALPSLLLLLSFFCARSQQNAPKQSHPPVTFSHWSLALETGPAFPVGAFGNTHSTGTSGNARTGGGAELSATYRFCPSLGVTVLAGVGLNPEHNGVTPVITPGGVYFLENQYKDWKMTRFLAGPTFEYPLAASGRVSLRLRALAGVLKTRLPDFTQYETSDATKSDAETWIYGKLPWAFVYQADAGLKWEIKRYLALTLDAGYMASKHTSNPYLTVVEANDGVVLSSAQAFKKTVDIGVIQCQAGVEFSL
jgi:hypothetical protein